MIIFNEFNPREPCNRFFCKVVTLSLWSIGIKYITTICLKEYILYTCAAEKQLNQNVDVRKMLDLLVWVFWFIFGGYSFWFFSQARTYQSLNIDDLALTWKLHKQLTGCKASFLQSLLTKNNNVVGFKCNCGHEYLQKRLITQKVHSRIPTSEVSMGDSKVDQLMQNIGLNYLNIKEIS